MSVNSGRHAFFFHAVNPQLSWWQNQAALLLCNSHLTPERSTSVKTTAAQLFFSDSPLTNSTRWWRAWSSLRVASHSSLHSTRHPTGLIILPSPLPIMHTQGWVGAERDDGTQNQEPSAVLLNETPALVDPDTGVRRQRFQESLEMWLGIPALSQDSICWIYRTDRPSQPYIFAYSWTYHVNMPWNLHLPANTSGILFVYTSQTLPSI